MKVLVTGAQGQLAQDLTEHCKDAGDDVVALSRTDLDITDHDEVRSVIGSAQPDVVVNCAAWTAVDDCESDPDRANRVNGSAVGYLAQAVRETSTHLVQVSTDYVFDGSKTGPYVESDPTNPQSVYGRSKLLGEQLANDDATIVRTSWLYSTYGSNMVATICRLMNEHRVLRFVDDQIGRPTCTVDLAFAIRQLAFDRAVGPFHCANVGAVSWHEFAQAVFVAAGEDPRRVEPIATADLMPSRPAARPANSVLDCQRYESRYPALPDFRVALPGIVRTYR